MRLGLPRPRVQRALLPYWFIVPAVVGLVLFSIYPFLSGIWYSFTSIGWVGDDAQFVGLRNYQQLWTGDVGVAKLFKESFVRSIQWTVLVVGGQFLIGLGVALVLNERFPGRSLFRTLTMLPIALPTVIMVLTWQWMYDPYYGLINHYLVQWGLLDDPKIWVGQNDSTLWPLVVVGIWRGFPFMALMLLSGLQGIPDELYDAAKVDGAGAVARFSHVTLPQMRTIIGIAIMLHILWWWNHFDILLIIGAMGQQFAYGSSTLPILSWVEAFRWSHLGLGAAVSVLAMLGLGGVILWNARRELRAV
ncbi:MAG TPA: sugar ABC transporter permease [Anaerolineales bacterium]|nr:sugar ABC transporter permease [Anaerolineales bacterium]